MIEKAIDCLILYVFGLMTLLLGLLLTAITVNVLWEIVQAIL